jgi:hypothetical protein
MGFWRFLVFVIIFLGSIACLSIAMLPLMIPIFYSNLWLNGFILFVFSGGLIYGVLSLWRVTQALRLLTAGAKDPEEFLKKIDWEIFPPSSLLHPLSEVLKAQRISQNARLFLQEFFASGFQTTHEGMRYLMGGLVFLGLLGTFWGLSLTIHAISQVIAQLPTDHGSGLDFFQSFKDSLQRPLGGMSTAFGTSLFGIAASLVLGFLDLQLGNASSFFLKKLEELLERVKPLFISNAEENFDASAFPESYTAAIWGHIGEHLDKLQKATQEIEKGRAQLHDLLFVLGERLACLTDHMESQQPFLLKMGEGQLGIETSLKSLVMDFQARPFHESLKWQLTQMDQLFQKLSEALNMGQKDMMEDLRQELRLLGKTLSAKGEHLKKRSFSV